METVESIVLEGKRYPLVATLAAGGAEGATNEVMLIDGNGVPLEYINARSTFSAKGQKVINGATEILPANASRIGLLIVNLDATNAVYIGDSNAVLTTNGVPLTPGGLTANSMSSRFTITDYVGPIYGIPAAGTPNVAYAEW